MDVFLLSVTPARPGSESPFELYCEPPPEPVAHPGGGADLHRAGIVHRLRSIPGRFVRGFKQALAEGEAEERRQEAGHPASQEGSRIGRFIKRKLAAAVAEQRLLWHLRHATSARLLHAETLTPARAIALATAEFARDYEKHRLWCGIDAAIVVASAPLALVPGPNFLAYYFIFRSVGHFFSLRGARKGMDASLWTTEPSPPLTELQAVMALPGPERDARVDAIGAALGLERLTAFVRRVASRPA
ncbi:MAG: hypothetical protein WC700_19615 [Gemmatimonadaceae bacterium]|jgi:hypothetical protein